MHTQRRKCCLTILIIAFVLGSIQYHNWLLLMYSLIYLLNKQLVVQAGENQEGSEMAWIRVSPEFTGEAGKDSEWLLAPVCPEFQQCARQELAVGHVLLPK